MPIIEIIKVYEDGTGAFTSIKTAIDANRQDLPANDKQLVFELSGQQIISGSFIDLALYTTDLTRNIVIRAKAGEKANGIAGYGATYNGGGTYVLVARHKHVVFDGIELAGGRSIHSATNVTVQNCLAHDIDSWLSTDIGAQYYNCILYDCGLPNDSGSNGVYLLNAKMHRCTLVADLAHGGYGGQILSRYSKDISPATQTIHVNESIGGHDNYHPAYGTLNDYNADSEGKAPGTNTFTASLADFEDAANKNYNLSTSSPLYTAGPSGEPIGAILASAPVVIPAVTIDSVIAEQIEQGQVNSITTNCSVLGVNAEQLEQVDPVTLTSTVSIAAIIAEQIEQGQTQQITANNSLFGVNAEQLEHVVPVTLTSTVSIATIIAEQIEQGQTHPITVNYSLFGVNAEQLEQIQPITLTSTVSIATINAEQKEQASPISLSGANVVISLIAEQIEQGQANQATVNYSLFSLNAAQLEQAEPVTLASSISINSVMGEQLEQTSFIEQEKTLAQSLLRSNQISLIKTTFHYKLMKNTSTITTIKTTPTYSIQKV